MNLLNIYHCAIRFFTCFNMIRKTKFHVIPQPNFLHALAWLRKVRYAESMNDMQIHTRYQIARRSKDINILEPLTSGMTNTTINLKFRTAFVLNIIFCICLSVFLIGCKPKPPFLEKTPDGPPKFQQGWKDGCETGLAMSGNTAYKNFYRFKQDPYGAQDMAYYKGWKDAMWFCSRRVEMWLARKVDDVSLLPKLDSLSWSADRKHSIWGWFGWGGMGNNPMAERSIWDGILPDEKMLIPMTRDGKY